VTQNGHGINGGGAVKPNMDQLINIPGIDNDYSDDYLKGGGGNSSGVLKPGGASPSSGFDS